LKVLVVGGGAREHTLVWKLLQSPKVGRVYVAPGNAGTAAVAENPNISADDIPSLARAAEENHIDLAVIGPEGPLAEGIVDELHARGIAAFGPTRAAARIESSKVFAKELMQKYGIPCARSVTFTSYPQACDYVKEQGAPIVVKADGLAAGKGSIVALRTEDALHALSDIMEKRIFGQAGDQVLVEECLIGREVSLLAFTDGRTVVPMVPACDYKRAYDGDHGPNTGGMGCYSPPAFFTPELRDEVTQTILQPTVRSMAAEGVPYRGVLYAGLLVTAEGANVLEFNARFGDPENQVQLPRLRTDLVDIMLAVIEGTLDEVNIEWRDEACVGVVMASGGYPGSYQTGFPISGLDSLEEGVLAFHAGTRLEGGQVVTSGGRVLTIAALGKNLAEAREKAYRNVARVHFENCHYRSDIAAIER